jgi:hypothetical protein
MHEIEDTSASAQTSLEPMQRIIAIQGRPLSQRLAIGGRRNNEVGGNFMRNIILLGTAALALTFSAAGAYAGNLDPHESPYAVISPVTVAPAAMAEGHAAYVGGDEGNMFGFFGARQPPYGCYPDRARIRGVWRNVRECD